MAIQKINLADQIASVLQDRIVAGEFAADSPLRQDVIAAELGISKIPLREAFAKLEQVGLVVSLANRGFFVRPTSPEEARDVFDLRLKIEPDLVGRASVRATPSDVALARDALDHLDKAVDGHGPGVGALHRAFHLALVKPALAPVSEQIVERLHVIAERYVVRHLAPSGRAERAREEHATILAAWSKADAALVTELSHRHIANTLDDLQSEF